MLAVVWLVGEDTHLSESGVGYVVESVRFRNGNYGECEVGGIAVVEACVADAEAGGEEEVGSVVFSGGGTS